MLLTEKMVESLKKSIKQTKAEIISNFKQVLNENFVNNTIIRKQEKRVNPLLNMFCQRVDSLNKIVKKGANFKQRSIDSF